MSGSQSGTGSPSIAYSVYIPAQNSADIAELVRLENEQQQQASISSSASAPTSSGSASTVGVGQESG